MAARARSLRGLSLIVCASVAAVVVGRSSRAQTAGNTASAAPQRPASRAVTIAATGDVLVHRRVVAAAQTHASEGGFRWILSALGAQLPATDVGFVNLESPLTEAFRSPANSTPPVLGAPTSYGADLAATGFDVLSVANNHAFDQAGDGLAITLDAIRAAGMVSVGAGRTEADARAPVVVVRDGVRVAFVATTERMKYSP